MISEELLFSCAWNFTFSCIMQIRERLEKCIRKICRQPLCDSVFSDDSDDNALPPKTPKHDPASRLKGGFNSHHICTLPSTGTKKYPQRKCRLCTKNGRRKDTRYFCKECQIALCNKPCFGKYHAQKHL